MTKGKALQQYFESFGLTAYPVNAIPEDVTFPYLTYENVIGSRGSSASPTVNLWYYSDSHLQINEKADQISKAIAEGDSISCDDGAIYVYQRDAWHPLSDENDPAIKRRYTNLTLIFNTL